MMLLSAFFLLCFFSLRNMKSPPVQNADWIGGLQDYFMGPGFHEGSHLTLKLEVNNEAKLVDITNVIATIQGTTEPGEILQSHLRNISLQCFFLAKLSPK